MIIIYLNYDNIKVAFESRGGYVSLGVNIPQLSISRDCSTQRSFTFGTTCNTTLTYTNKSGQIINITNPSATIDVKLDTNITLTYNISFSRSGGANSTTFYFMFQSCINPETLSSISDTKTKTETISVNDNTKSNLTLKTKGFETWQSHSCNGCTMEIGFNSSGEIYRSMGSCPPSTTNANPLVFMEGIIQVVGGQTYMTLSFYHNYTYSLT